MSENEKKEVKTTGIKLRLTPREKEMIIQKARAAKMNKSKYILSAISGHPVIVMEGLKDLAYQLRKIGNNLNQLTTLANQRQIITLELEGTKKEIHQIWRSLNSLIDQTRRRSSP